MQLDLDFHAWAVGGAERRANGTGALPPPSPPEDRTTISYRINQQPGPKTYQFLVPHELILAATVQPRLLVNLCALRKPQPASFHLLSLARLSLLATTPRPREHRPSTGLQSACRCSDCAWLPVSRHSALPSLTTWPHRPSIGLAGSLLSRHCQSALSSRHLSRFPSSAVQVPFDTRARLA